MCQYCRQGRSVTAMAAFSGQAALVTGGSKGIGFAIAAALLDRGARRDFGPACDRLIAPGASWPAAHQTRT
jgi:NAD(P)-dependent dehydrogenase (short-subunit alcohol dehydrogenase family)